MAKLSEKTQQALDESLILVTGAEILVGFSYRSTFESGFEKLPEVSRYLVLASLGLMLVALVLLISPVAYHQIVLKERLTENFQSFMREVMALALLPFALALGVTMYVATEKIDGNGLAILAGVV